MKSKQPHKWITVGLDVHIRSRRIARLLPLRIEPGRKFLLGSRVKVRGVGFVVKGFGYRPSAAGGDPVIHLEKVTHRSQAVPCR